MKRASQFLQDYGVLVAFLLLVAINLATRGANFLQPENLRNLISQNATIGIIAVGMTFVIITAGIDLSVGSMVGLCGAVTILVLNKYSSGSPNTAILLAGLASIGVGTFFGLFNGVVIAYGRVAPFVVTLAGMAGFRSLAEVLGGGGEIRSTVTAFQDFGFGGIPLPGLHQSTGGPVVLYWSAVVLIVSALFAGFLLNRTRFGRYVVAVGANERAAKYSAINTQTIKVATYTLLGTLTGLSAFLLAARMNSIGTGSAGNNYELDAIAAVVIGGTSLRGGKGKIWGTVVGVLLLTIITNMMTAYRIDTNWQSLVKGAVILLAALLQRGSKE